MKNPIFIKSVLGKVIPASVWIAGFVAVVELNEWATAEKVALLNESRGDGRRIDLLS